MKYRFGILGTTAALLLGSFQVLQLSLPAQEPVPVFRSEVAIVEVFAAVLDQKGRHVGGIPQQRFVVLDNGKPQPIVSFEAETTDIKCAILLDSTGSMQDTLPVMKNATIRLIERFRPNDWFALYSFNTSLTPLIDFTQDRTAAKRAVLRVRTGGATALFDSISKVAADMAGDKGKRAIIVFTDGQDNASALNAKSALARVRKVGVPLYTVAYGEALKNRVLTDSLRSIAKETGGESFQAKRSQDIEDVFNEISGDLKNTYMITYAVPPSENNRWHQIQLTVRDMSGVQIRAREGYTPN
jgi:Ca-activated chloride channel homolog